MSRDMTVPPARGSVVDCDAEKRLAESPCLPSCTVAPLSNDAEISADRRGDGVSDIVLRLPAHNRSK